MSGITLRPPREDEIPAIVELMNAVSEAEHAARDTSEVELRRWFTSPSVELGRDVRLAVADGGELAAYGDIGDQSDQHTRYWLDARVHPSFVDSGAAEALIEWAEERARLDAVDGAVLRAYAWSTNMPAKRALERAGFRLIRHSYRMEIDLDAEPPEAPWPDGVEVRTMRPGDERAVYDVKQETFADSWEHTPDPYAEWEHWTLAREDFDPTLWFVARDGDEIAGISLCRQHETRERVGWVDALGVRRPWRRKGLGRALLLHSFEEFRRRGFAAVGLGVDAESLTGAQRLYESVGMRVVRRGDIYDRPLAVGSLPG